MRSAPRGSEPLAGARVREAAAGAAAEVRSRAHPVRYRSGHPCRVSRANADRGFSLCLQGPPGTGKSAFARYLAERLGLEVLQKRASDLLSPWVGETEQQIAAAFAEARDAQAFLIFDEADSLLADRRSAHRSWEVSQVNEMLTWMESHPLPFACTTNFGEHLDPATLRRFVFKVRLDYLAPAQVEEAFRAYFALPPPTASRTLPPSRPGTSRWCTGRRGSWENTGSRKHSRPCFAPSATRSRTAPARSDSGRRRRGTGFRPFVVPPFAGARYHAGMSWANDQKAATMRYERLKRTSCALPCGFRERPAG